MSLAAIKADAISLRDSVARIDGTDKMVRMIKLSISRKKFARRRGYLFVVGRGQLRHDVLFIGQLTNQIRVRYKQIYTKLRLNVG